MDAPAFQRRALATDSMQITLADAEGVARLTIEGGLEIANVTEAKPPLLAAIAAHTELEMDLSGVATLDVAGLQLLIICKIEAIRRGHRLQLLQHSPAVLGTLDLFNLAAFFGDPLVLPPGHDMARQGGAP